MAEVGINYFWEMFKMFLALGAVVALLVLLGKYLPRWLRSSKYFPPREQFFQITQRVNLGSRKQLVLVENDDTKLLLGVTDNKISLLKDMSDSQPGITEMPKDVLLKEDRE